MVSEDHFVPWRRIHYFAMHVNGAVFLAVLGVPDGISIAAVSFATVAPAVLRKPVEIVVIENGHFALG